MKSMHPQNSIEIALRWIPNIHPKISLAHPQLQHFILTTRGYLLSIWTPIDRKNLYSKKIDLGQGLERKNI